MENGNDRPTSFSRKCDPGLFYGSGSRGGKYRRCCRYRAMSRENSRSGLWPYEPDSSGEYQVHCSICGAPDVLNANYQHHIQFCYNCAACLLDEEPAGTLSLAEIIREEYGDMIDRDEEESD